MSRRQLSLVVVTIASLIVTACASPTAPQPSAKAGAAHYDTAPDTTGRIGTLGSG
jgi:outer membrane biogenesis lipoprotein LolB